MRFRTRLMGCFMPCALIGSASHASDPSPVVGFYKLDDQRLTGETTAIAESASFSSFDVLVTVDTTGKVIAAEPYDNYQRLDPAPALALVRGWTFRPQTFDGNPVTAVGKVSVDYRKRPIPADLSVAFPAGNPTDTSITLERSACFGTCPDYRVTVHGDGLVEFDTGDDHFKGTAAQLHLEYNGHNVLLPGRHTAHIDPAAAARLIDRFRAAHFFGLKNEYFYGATDNPTQILTVRIGRANKKVTDYIGTLAGMPQDVRDLEQAVDTVAGTARWVDGNAQTLDDLDAAHFDFRSHAAAMLTAAAASKFSRYRAPEGAEALLLGLVSRGVPLDTRINDGTLGAMLVEVAAERGSEQLFDKLAASGVLAHAPAAALNWAFTHIGCSPQIARALVRAGADPHAASDEGTALTALRGVSPTCEEHPDRMIEMARTLIELGVPLEARDNLGWTALMGCESPEFVTLLLAHGADPKAREKDGTTPVLSTDDDRVALILLRAGADPRARNESGTVREQAIKVHMPATLAWLDAHGIS